MQNCEIIHTVSATQILDLAEKGDLDPYFHKNDNNYTRQTLVVVIPKDLTANGYALDGYIDINELAKFEAPQRPLILNYGEELSFNNVIIARETSNEKHLMQFKANSSLQRHAKDMMPKPVNIRRLMKEVIISDEVKVNEILNQYRELNQYQALRDDSNYCLKLLNSLCHKKRESNFITIPGMMKVRKGISENSPPVFKDYCINPALTLIAILASNECIYFYNIESRKLTGDRLFNKRHHGATRVLFNPTISNILVVFGGPNGLTVYYLKDLTHLH